MYSQEVFTAKRMCLVESPLFEDYFNMDEISSEGWILF